MQHSRRSNGCWTCLPRHRKCDHETPHCRECTSRKITCHGYGAKPDWMEDPMKQQRELQRLKGIVNAHFRQVRKSHHLRVSRGPGQHPELDDTSKHTSDKSHANVSLRLRRSSANTAGSSTSFDEAQLILHYFDCIFWLQFPCYQPCEARIWRVWLFWLLDQRGPLRWAALSLSALHSQSSVPQISASSQSTTLRYHMTAIQKFRQSLSAWPTRESGQIDEKWVEILICGIALISFEVCSPFLPCIVSKERSQRF